MRQADGALVYVPAIDRSLMIRANAVKQHAYVDTPSGEPALMLLLDVDSKPVQAIVASTDLVFAPDTGDSGFGIAVDVTNAPPLVGFSEMVRDIGRVEKTWPTEENFDKVIGNLVLLRYFVAGAKRLGIECTEAESKVQRLWELTGLASVAQERSTRDRSQAVPEARPSTRSKSPQRRTRKDGASRPRS
jgi:hypothetical protein